MASDPLADVRVLELARGWSSSALAGSLLSQLGAQVTTIQLPDKPQTTEFQRLTAGKRRVLLDVSHAAAKGALREEVQAADILIFDFFWLESLQAHGLGERDLAVLAPGLVACCMSPYGLTGPLSNVPASDLTVQAMAGILASNGFPGDPPVRAGIPAATCAGAILGSVAVIAALVEQRAFGVGQFVDHAQYDSLAAFLGTLLPSYLIAGAAPRRMGNRHGMTAPWNAYRCTDGWAVICIFSQRHWISLAQVMCCTELGTDRRFMDLAGRLENVDDLDAAIEAWTRTRKTGDVVAAVTSIGVPSGAVTTLREAMRSPHLWERELAARMPDGTLLGAGIPKVSTSPLRTSEGRLGRNQADLPCEGRGSRGDPEQLTGSVLAGGPLTGLRVVEIGSLTAGPLLGKFLAVLGAEVIKIEPPQGEASRHLTQRTLGEAYLFHTNNTDKLSCVLDLADLSDQDKCRELIASADVFISNLSAETLEGWGLGQERLSVVNPAIIYGSVTGYGLTGSLAKKKAFDTVIQAETGIMSMTGLPNGPPVKIAISMADVLGACAGTLGVLAALVYRLRTGCGAVVDASLFDACIWTTQALWPGGNHANEEPRERMGNRHWKFAPHNCFRAKDGFIAIAVETDEQWAGLLKATGRADLLDDSRFATATARVLHVDEVEQLLAAWTSMRTAIDVVTACWANGVPAAPSADVPSVVEHPHTANREMIVTLPGPDGDHVKVVGSPFKFSRTPAKVKALAPSLGQHNEMLIRKHQGPAG